MLRSRGEIPESELERIRCHFNGNIVKLPKSHGYFVERIAVIDVHLSVDKPRNLVQLYAAKGYFAYLLYMQRRISNPEDKTNEENKENAVQSLHRALEHVDDNNIGYKLVIYGNLIFLYNDMKLYDKAKDYLEAYNNICLLYTSPSPRDS